MAMIKCKECNAEMSEQAEKCPKCGCPNVPKITCPECGESVYKNATTCPSCGYTLNKSNTNKGIVNGKSKIVAGILGILLGAFGVHNFYLGNTSKAVAQLLITILSCGFLSMISGIWGLVEGIMILTGSINTDGNGNPLAD